MKQNDKDYVFTLHHHLSEKKLECLKEAYNFQERLHQDGFPAPAISKMLEPVGTNAHLTMMEYVAGIHKDDLSIDESKNLGRILGRQKLLASNYFTEQEEESRMAHGDLQPQNILFSANGEITFIDYDNAHKDYPNYDLCSLIFYYFTDDKCQLQQDKFNSFIEGINEYYHLSDKELETLNTDIRNSRFEILCKKFSKGNNIPSVAIFQDLDGTIVPSIYDNERTTYPCIDELIKRIEMLRNHGGVSIFSTGRPFEQVLSDPLLQNYPVDYIMSGVGTELYQNINGEYVIDEEFTHYILMPDNDKEPFNPINIDSRIKDNLFLQKIGIKKHHGVPFSEVICGYSVPFADEIDEKKLQMALTEAMEEIDFKAIVYPNTHSRRYNIDILPSKAGKDGATKWLIPRMKSEGKIIDAAIIAGDSGNDIPAMNPALYQNLGINHVTIVGSPNSQEAVVKYLNNISEESGVNVIYDRAQEQKNAQFIAEAIDSTVLAYNSKSTPFSVLSNNSRSEWNGKVASFAPCQHYG